MKRTILKIRHNRDANNNSYKKKDWTYTDTVREKDCPVSMLSRDCKISPFIGGMHQSEFLEK